MLRNVIIIVLLISTFSCTAQGMFGAEAGLGKATTAKSYITPAFKGYYLTKLSRSFYVGGTINFERYSFLEKYNTGSIQYGDVISIRNKSSFVFFSPTIDWGLGYRKYVHIHFAMGAGLLAGGRQVTNMYEPYSTVAPVYTAADTTGLSTSYNLPVLASRFALGVSERIHTSGYWNIMLTQEFSYVPTNLTTHGPNLKTNYIAFTIGIMHKYPMVLIED